MKSWGLTEKSDRVESDVLSRGGENREIVACSIGTLLSYCSKENGSIMSSWHLS